jgi:hypothetical protein
MDREQFDALTRLFAHKQSRRGALAAILGVGLLGRGPRVLAASDKAVGKGHHKDNGKGHAKGKGRGHEQDGQCDPANCPADPSPGGKPGFCCKDGSCSCGGKCCGDRCFQTGPVRTPTDEFCCGEPRRLDNGALLREVYCPNADKPEDSKCCPDVGEESCISCILPGGIPGSYRRPR